MPLLDRERDGARDPLEHLLARDAERLQLEIRDRALDHRRLDAELDERLDVGGNRAREAPDLRAQTGVGDQPDRLGVLRRDAREAGLDPVDAGVVERTRDLELVLRAEDDADGLLAVAERRVVEADRAGRLRLECAAVQVSGPDLLAIQSHDPTIASTRHTAAA